MSKKTYHRVIKVPPRGTLVRITQGGHQLEGIVSHNPYQVRNETHFSIETHPVICSTQCIIEEARIDGKVVRHPDAKESIGNFMAALHKSSKAIKISSEILELVDKYFGDF